MSDYQYILNGKIPVPEPDLMKWAEFMETANRIVKSDVLPLGVHLSTVFLGIDHAFGGGTPLLFETMVFGGEGNGWQRRYATWEDAERGHEEKRLELAFSLS